MNIQKYLKDNENAFQTLNFNVNEEVEKDMKTVSELYQAFSNHFLNSSDNDVIEQTRKVIAMKGGALTPSHLALLLILKAFLAILNYLKYGKQSNNGYGISSQPYSQKPFGIPNYRLTLTEKAGMRQLMDELDALSRMISLKLINPDNKKLPPYSMIKEMNKMGINLDDDRYLVNPTNNTTSSSIANMLRKYVEYMTLVLDSMIGYYTEMDSKKTSTVFMS